MQVIVKKDEAKAYHSEARVSNSLLTQLKKSPAHYLDAMRDINIGVKEKETDTFILGSVFHASLLEPESVSKMYRPKMYSGTTKEGKAEKEKAERDGVQLVRKDLWDTARAMAEKTFESPFWSSATQGKRPGEFFTETSLYWQEDSGIQCKARVDCYSYIEGFGPAIIDLKSTSDASIDGIQSSMAKFGYHRQAAWYTRAMRMAGYEVNGFIFLFVEKFPPYVHTLALVSEDAMAQGLTEIKTLMEKLEVCNKTGSWPGYSPVPVAVNLPEWYYKKEMSNA